jgi:flavin-dependent dehydrogenase
MARSGASVLLIDRAEFPRWKVCGACLSAGALDQLAAVGLTRIADELGAVPLRTLVLSAGGRRAHLPLEGTRVVSRAALDTALVNSARDGGVEFWSGAKATSDEVGPGHRTVRVVRGGTVVDVAAAVVLDATGLGRGLETTRGRRESVARGSRVGIGATFLDPAYPIRAGALHMVVAREGYVGVVRDERGMLTVAAAVDPSALKERRPRDIVAQILSRSRYAPLRGESVTEWRGTPLLTRSPNDVGAERLFRVGDSAGYVEPFTGEGMCWALSGARAVAPLAVAGARQWESALLDRWRAYHGQTFRRSRRLSGMLAPALRRPWLVSGALAALGVAPRLAAPLVRRAAAAPAHLAAHT